MSDLAVQSEPTPNAEPSVGIVIVNYNSYELTAACIHSLKQLDYRNYFIVIVDNRSPDGSGYQLEQEFSSTRCHVIFSPENKGFAAGNNMGMRHARAYGAELLWLLNADTTVESAALSSLVAQSLAAPRAAAFGSKVLYHPETVTAEDGRSMIWSAGAKIAREKRDVEMRGAGEEDRGQFNEIAECDYIPGCSFLLRTTVLDEVGYMPEEYFMYFEETEWCEQMTQQGLKLYYVPSSVVFHKFDDEKMQQPFCVYYYNRNRLLFWYRRLAPFARLSFLWQLLRRDIPRVRHALRAAPDETHRALFRAHLKSYFDFLLRRFGKRTI